MPLTNRCGPVLPKARLLTLLSKLVLHSRATGDAGPPPRDWLAWSENFTWPVAGSHPPTTLLETQPDTRCWSSPDSAMQRIQSLAPA